MRRALLVAITAATIAGCGSSTLSDHDLRAEAAGICKGASLRLNRGSQPSTATAALPFLRRGLAVLGPELAALRRLAPGTDLSATYHATVANFGAAVQRVRGTIAVLTSGGDPVSSFTTLEHELTSIVAGENAGWRRLQIPACVSR